MNRLIAVLLALTLIMSFAVAEEYGAMADIAAGECVFDLNGDGKDENINVFYQYSEEDFEDTLCVRVTDIDGVTAEFQTSILYDEKALIADIDADDGMLDVLVSGDVMSEDFITYCLRYDGHALKPLQFQYAAGELYVTGPGEIGKVLGEILVLSDWEDVLGTWWGSAPYILNDTRDTFIKQPEAMWTFTYDDEQWEDRSLEVATMLPVTLMLNDVETSSTLKPGEKLLVTASDMQTIVHFMLQDGTTGYFPITADTERGWGLTIYGTSEDDWFEYLPYAG